MNKKLLILLLMLSKNCFGQFYVKQQIVQPSCGSNNGIIVLETNANNPLYTWYNNEDFKDSVAFNLSPGNHTVKVQDGLSGSFQEITFTLNNEISDCSKPPLPSFSFIMLRSGIVRFNTAVTDINLKWDMGDGNMYKNIFPQITHKYLLGGNYNVCLTYFNNTDSNKVCQNIVVPTWTDLVEDTDFKKVSNSSGDGLEVINSCECGGKTFLMAYSVANSSIAKLYSFDLNSEIVTLLPIDQIYSGIYFNQKSECYNNKLYLSGRIGSSGYELCESDGTISGTRIVQNFVLASGLGINPNNFKVYQNTLYFDGLEQSSCCEFAFQYKFDGVSVQKISTSQNSFENSLIFQSKLFYNSGGLKSFDGSMEVDYTSSNRITKIFGEINGKLIFANSDNFYNLDQSECWISDGTIFGTQRLLPNLGLNTFNTSTISLNGLFYFIGFDDIHGHELWVSDGTSIGTRLLKDIFQGDDYLSVINLTIFNNKIYFFGKETANSEYELWETNGTTLGTKKVFSNKTIALKTSILKTIFTDGIKLYFYSKDNYLNYLDLNENLSQLPEIFCSKEIFYFSNHHFLGLNGKYYFGGTRNNVFGLYSTCNYSLSRISDKIFNYKDITNISFPINSQFLNFCNQIPSPNPYSSISDNSFIYSITDNLGCKSKLLKVSLYNNPRGTISALKVARCSISEIRVLFKYSGVLTTNDSLKIRVYSPTLGILKDLQTIENNGELIGLIPNNLQNTQLESIIIVKYFDEIIQSSIFKIPEIHTSLGGIVVSSDTLYRGDSTMLSLIFNGNPPYNFTLNGSEYNNILKNAYYFETRPLNDSTYSFSNFSNSCGYNILFNSPLNIIVSNCRKTINHSNNLNGGIFKAFGKIESNGIITSPQNLVYESEKSISLNPGFIVSPGAIFRASIQNCDH